MPTFISLFLLASAERSFNFLLRKNQNVLLKLDQLKGKVISIVCLRPSFTLYLQLNSQGIQLSLHEKIKPNCQLIAPLFQLLALLKSQDKKAILSHPSVNLVGDAQLLLTLSDILQSVPINWEDELPIWIGPIATQLISNIANKKINWTHNAIQIGTQSIQNYTNEESRYFVSQRENSTLFAELDPLKLRLDRIEARIKRFIDKNRTNNIL